MDNGFGPVCREHLEFMQWADNTMLSALSQITPDKLHHDFGNSFPTLFATLNHIYLAELAWLKRVTGEPGTKLADLTPPANIATLTRCFPEVHANWIDWAQSLGPERWTEPLLHSSSFGSSALPLWQIVFHVVNHGSYHRGQVATMFRQSGVKLPGTDLVLFYRRRQ